MEKEGGNVSSFTAAGLSQGLVEEEEQGRASRRTRLASSRGRVRAG